MLVYIYTLYKINIINLLDQYFGIYTNPTVRYDTV
uniref:Uncharacterized protein n=1 Tax=viral metagenome TaxID=1070528 RepID=A0A6C0CKE4_9ZZZZ